SQISANVQMPREQRNDLDDDMEEDRADFDQPMQIETPRQPQVQVGSGPQPEIEGMPADVAREQAAISGVNGHGEQRDAQPRQGDDDGQRRRARRPRRGSRGRDEAAEAVSGESGEQTGEAASAKAESAPEPAATEQAQD